jgi:molecular chaperone GrpE
MEINEEKDLTNSQDMGNEKEANKENNQNDPELVKENTTAQADNSSAEKIKEENQLKAEGTGGSEIAELEKLKSELAEYKDKYLRLYSDFENFRRRVAKEKLDFLRTANEELVKSLLPVVDDFERAQKSLESNDNKDGYIEGVKLIHSKFVKTLESKGLKPMNVKGEKFDMEIHEAITQIPGEEENKGKIVDEVEKGYFLNDKVIRFAKVVIGS